MTISHSPFLYYLVVALWVLQVVVASYASDLVAERVVDRFELRETTKGFALYVAVSVLTFVFLILFHFSLR